MNKTRKAVAIIDASMQAGMSEAEAASQAERQTGLSVIPYGPAVYYAWSFFILTGDGKRVLNYHPVSVPARRYS